jgi:hypothetical protein
MTTRNFNYTGRMFIPQECIDGRISKMGSGPPALEIDFDWTLAPHLDAVSDDAHVYVDADVDMSFMRFEYGTFGNTVAPENVLLSELDSWTSANFVIRVVKDGTLLAASKKHTVTLALPDTKSRRSLIIPEFRDLGERPWMLEVHDMIEFPKLVFNEKWWNAAQESGFPVQEDEISMGTIMPSVLEGMLNWLLIHQKCDDHQLHDDPSWRGSWIRFAKSLADTPAPQRDEQGEYESMEIVSDWIASVVANYSEKWALTSRLISQLPEGGGA